MSFGKKSISLAILSALLALAACQNSSLDPVFYTLSIEQPLGENRGFPDGASVFKMIKVPLASAPPSTDSYLAAASRLYIRGTGTSDNWTLVNPPAGKANAMCNALEFFNEGGTDYIYAGFFNSANGDGYGLFRAPLAMPITWAQVAVAAEPNTTEITLLKTVGTQLFVATNNGSNVNALYYWNGAAFAPVSLNAPTSTAGTDISQIPIFDVARATAGGSYWILVGPYLYQNASLPGPFAEYNSPPTIANAPVYPLSPTATAASGALLDDGNALYVAGGYGFLFSTANAGGVWAKSVQLKDDAGNPVHFTSLLSFFGQSSDPGAVYAGTMGQGYFRLPSGDVTLVTKSDRQPSYNIASLYSGALYFMYYDPAPTLLNLFLCTASAGLWRGGDNAGGAIWTWKQE